MAPFTLLALTAMALANGPVVDSGAPQDTSDTANQAPPRQNAAPRSCAHAPAGLSGALLVLPLALRRRR